MQEAGIGKLSLKAVESALQAASPNSCVFTRPLTPVLAIAARPDQRTTASDPSVIVSPVDAETPMSKILVDIHEQAQYRKAMNPE